MIAGQGEVDGSPHLCSLLALLRYQGFQAQDKLHRALVHLPRGDLSFPGLVWVREGPCLSPNSDLLGRKPGISSLSESQPHVLAGEGATS